MLKVAFFQKVWSSFPIAQKICRKLSWKKDFEIAFCLESADSNCTAVSKGGKIQNTKLRIEHSTFFGYIISVFAIVPTTRQLKYDRNFTRKTGLDPIGAV